MRSRTVLQLSAGRQALTSNTFIVSEDDLAVEKIFIVLPVIHELGVHTKKLLEQNCDVLDETECSFIQPSSTTGDNHVSWLMIAWPNWVANNSLFNPIDSVKPPKIAEEMDNAVRQAVNNCTWNADLSTLKDIVPECRDIFSNGTFNWPTYKARATQNHSSSGLNSSPTTSLQLYSRTESVPSDTVENLSTAVWHNKGQRRYENPLLYLYLNRIRRNSASQ